MSPVRIRSPHLPALRPHVCLNANSCIGDSVAVCILAHQLCKALLARSHIEACCEQGRVDPCDCRWCTWHDCELRGTLHLGAIHQQAQQSGCCAFEAARHLVDACRSTHFSVRLRVTVRAEQIVTSCTLCNLIMLCRTDFDHAGLCHKHILQHSRYYALNHKSRTLCLLLHPGTRSTTDCPAHHCLAL